MLENSQKNKRGKPCVSECCKTSALGPFTVRLTRAYVIRILQVKYSPCDTELVESSCVSGVKYYST